MQTGVQQEFAYIPDDYSATYVVNVENNSTRTLPSPSVKDTKSSYTAGITSLVQLDSTGLVYFVPYVPGNDSSANANAAGATSRLSLPFPLQTPTVIRTPIVAPAAAVLLLLAQAHQLTPTRTGLCQIIP